jgi:protein involved in polysaccharide export with SLBB domain
MERPGGPDDLVLRAGDQILIPEFDPTVSVRGSVTFETRAVFESGMGVSEYIQQAGGSLDDANLNRVSVEYANGRRATTKKFLWLIRQHPRVEPGSTILVPAKAPSQGDAGLAQLLNRTVTLATTVLTLLVLSDQIRN